MGYLFLSLSVLAGAVKGFCGKKTSSALSTFRDAMLANMLRMIICSLLGIAVIIIGGDIGELAPSAEVLIISAISGITTSAFVVFWMVSVKNGAYMMVDVVLMAGTLIPVTANSIIYGEQIKAVQWLGFAFMVVAALLMCSYNNSLKKKLTVPSILILAACGISSGFSDLSQKLFVNQASSIPVSVFNFYTYVFSALTLIICFFAFGIKEHSYAFKFEGRSVSRKIAVYILIMSVCLFASSYFKTLAAASLDAVYIYPLSQGSALIISSLMAWLLFGEKITVKCAFGLVLSFSGILMINFL